MKTILGGRHRHLQEGPNAQTDYEICKNQQNRQTEVNQCERGVRLDTKKMMTDGGTYDVKDGSQCNALKGRDIIS